MSYIGEYKFDPNIIIHKKMHVDKSFRHSMSKGGYFLAFTCWQY